MVLARASAFWRGVRTPPIELKSFSDQAAANRYLRRLAAALVDRDALDLALPALASGKTCAEEPSTLYAVVMEPLLETGRAEEAMTAHRRGWRLAAEEETQIDQAASSHGPRRSATDDDNVGADRVRWHALLVAGLRQLVMPRPRRRRW